MMYQPWEQAVIDYQNKKLLLDLKHGGEHAEDITPGGWWLTWDAMTDKLQDELISYGLNDHDISRVFHALDIKFVRCGSDCIYCEEKDQDVE